MLPFQSSQKYNTRSVTFPQEAARDPAGNVDYEERRRSRMKMAEGEEYKNTEGELTSLKRQT